MKDTGNEVRESVTYLSIIMILVGIILIFIGQTVFHTNDLLLKAFDSMGVLITGVFATSLLYEKFLAEKHFREFGRALRQELHSLDTIQAKALKLGIRDIFETRAEYQMQIPLSKLIEMAEEGSDFYCVAKSLYNFLNKNSELIAGLKKGLKFKLALVDPGSTTPEMHKMMYLYEGDIVSALNALDSLLEWASREHYSGTLELVYHKFFLIDSCTIVKIASGHLIIWDLSFGRDLSQKKLMMLQESSGETKTLACDLITRYQDIYDQSTPMFRVEAGSITLNSIPQFIKSVTTSQVLKN